MLATRSPLSVVRNPFRSIFGVPACLALIFFGAMFWAKGRDPFQRIWFKVRAPGYGKAACIAVLPKMALRPLPVVIYLHGSGGSFLDSGNELRQIAEMGLAVIGMDYKSAVESRGSRAENEDPADGAIFDAQFTALLEYVRRQEWADTNRIAWVGFSLGAQRMLAYALGHREAQPNVLVRMGGGWVPELERAGSTNRQPAGNVFRPGLKVLLVHGSNDEVFPVQDVHRLSALLRSNGVPAEVKIVPGAGHGFGPDRLVVCRQLGEGILTSLNGPDALSRYRSILDWQAQAKPLWFFWLPALFWVLLWWWARHRAARAEAEAIEPGPLRWWEIGLRVTAVILAVAAAAQTGLHVVPPRLAITPRTLGIAREHLIQPKERADFDFLASKSCWTGNRLKTLLTHVELANYNRELINWKLDDAVYRDYVLSAEIDPAFDGDLNWRRPLWENFYPRIRKENDTESAAEIVVRFLRERVTIADIENAPRSIGDSWERQITTGSGFEALYVAALRSCGVPARLDANGQAEFWAGSEWRAAPRPLVLRRQA